MGYSLFLVIQHVMSHVDYWMSFRLAWFDWLVERKSLLFHIVLLGLSHSLFALSITCISCLLLSNCIIVWETWPGCKMYVINTNLLCRFSTACFHARCELYPKPKRLRCSLLVLNWILKTVTLTRWTELTSKGCVIKKTDQTDDIKKLWCESARKGEACHSELQNEWLLLNAHLYVKICYVKIWLFCLILNFLIN